MPEFPLLEILLWDESISLKHQNQNEHIFFHHHIHDLGSYLQVLCKRKTLYKCKKLYYLEWLVPYLELTWIKLLLSWKSERGTLAQWGRGQMNHKSKENNGQRKAWKWPRHVLLILAWGGQSLGWQAVREEDHLSHQRLHKWWRDCLVRILALPSTSCISWTSDSFSVLFPIREMETALERSS